MWCRPKAALYSARNLASSKFAERQERTRPALFSTDRGCPRLRCELGLTLNSTPARPPCFVSDRLVAAEVSRRADDDLTRRPSLPICFCSCRILPSIDRLDARTQNYSLAKGQSRAHEIVGSCGQSKSGRGEGERATYFFALRPAPPPPFQRRFQNEVVQPIDNLARTVVGHGRACHHDRCGFVRLPAKRGLSGDDKNDGSAGSV